MGADILQNLEKMIGTLRDGALLRFSIGNEYLKRNDAAAAARSELGAGASPSISCASATTRRLTEGKGIVW